MHINKRIIGKLMEKEFWLTLKEVIYLFIYFRENYFKLEAEKIWNGERRVENDQRRDLKISYKIKIIKRQR